MAPALDSLRATGGERATQLSKDDLEKIKADDEADLKEKRRVFEENFKPPTGRKEHSRTAVLLLYWDKNDIKVAPEVS